MFSVVIDRLLLITFSWFCLSSSSVIY